VSEGKNSRTTFVVLGLTVASLAIQLWIAARPDTMGDVSNGFRLWCRALAEHGLEAYWHPEELQAVGGFPLDHPPVTPYLYWIVGKSFAALAPQAFLENDALVDLLIKLPFVIANLLLGLLVFRELRRHASPRVATWGFAAVALNPALIFNTSSWGQTDSLCALGVAVAFAAVFRRRYALAWAAIVFAALVKPFGYAFVPLLGMITLNRAGLTGALRGLAGGVAATFLLFLPFVIIGRFVDLLREVLLQLDAMPYVSVNAHNLWWILGGGLPFVDVGGRLLDTISYRAIGLVLVATFYLALLWRWWRSPATRDSWFYPASVALGFFMLSTHMHENHLIYFIPLAAPFALRQVRTRWIFAGLSTTILMNMLLHDPELASARIFTMGPIIEIPYALGAHISVFRLGLTILNTQLGLLLAILWVAGGAIPASAATDGSVRRIPIGFRWVGGVVVATVLLLATSLPFAVRNAEATIVRVGPRRLPGEDVRFDMIARLNSAAFGVEGSHRIILGTFRIEGDSREVIFSPPGATMSFKLVVPDRGRLRFSQGMPEDVWSESRSDGVEFRVDVKTEGSTFHMHRQLVDPAHLERQRRWVDVDLDLGEFAGRRVTLVLYTTPGPGRNYLADWPGWGNPRIVAGD